MDDNQNMNNMNMIGKNVDKNILQNIISILMGQIQWLFYINRRTFTTSMSSVGIQIWYFFQKHTIDMMIKQENYYI